ncbi:MAG: hypothetical protein WCL61_03905 [bacterium]
MKSVIIKAGLILVVMLVLVVTFWVFNHEVRPVPAPKTRPDVWQTSGWPIEKIEKSQVREVEIVSTDFFPYLDNQGKHLVIRVLGGELVVATDSFYVDPVKLKEGQSLPLLEGVKLVQVIPALGKKAKFSLAYEK